MDTVDTVSVLGGFAAGTASTATCSTCELSTRSSLLWLWDAHIFGSLMLKLHSTRIRSPGQELMLKSRDPLDSSDES